MRARGGGQIVVLGSLTGYVQTPGFGAYSASKAAATAREFRSKLIRVRGLIVCGGRRVGGRGHGRTRTPWDWWGIVLVGPVLRNDAQSGVPGLGYRCETRCATGSGWAMRCVVTGRDARGTAEVVNEFGSAVLAANLGMTCLGSPATLGSHRPDEP